MLIHSAEITGSVQFNNTDVSGITNVSSFATTASVNTLIVRTGSYASTSSVNELSSSINQVIKDKINAEGVISGSSQLTSSYDNRYVLSGSITQTTWDNIANKPAGIVSSSIQIIELGFATTSSVNNLQSVTGSYASTGSNQFNGNQSISGSITSNGTITAQTLVVQTVTSSVEFVTGSTRNGSIAANTHEFTGSVLMTGSLSVVTTGTELQVNASGVNIGNALTDNHVISGSVRINSNGLFISSSGDVGIGTITPASSRKLTIAGGVQITTGDNSGASFNIVPGATGQAGADLNLSYYTGTGFGPLTFTLGGSERMRITSTGSVGIGTTSPGLNLSVQGLYGLPTTSGAQTNGILRVQDSSSNISLDMGVIQYFGNWIQSINKSNSSNLILALNPNGGNVGIGTTSPNNRLEIRNDTNGDLAFWINNRATTASGTSNSIIFGGYRDAEDPFAVGKISVLHSGGSSGNLNHAGDMVFYTQQANPSTLSERMRISSTGVITKPFNPAFRAYFTTNGTWTLAANDTFIFNATEYNIGSGYNTSNGRFTAPVAGVYQFNFYTILLGAYSNGEIWFQKNGADLTSGTHIHFTTTAAGVWHNVHFVTSAYLNSGDYVSFVNKAQTVNYHGDDWSSFSGYLVG